MLVIIPANCRVNRPGNDSVAVTHEMLSIMLGVRGPGVTEAMNKLEELGLVSGSRGRVNIIDRKALEHFAGSAYGIAEANIAASSPPWQNIT